MYTINRHNYEEFFLMYVDDELTPSAKLEVENFVQQNADLAIELEMLMQTKLQPDEFVFNNKETLLRTEGNSINETNYEEYFLLYIDNELSTSKRTEVEKFILQHPQLQQEFELLKQTVVPTENITYNNKEDLYKYEKKRVVYLKPFQLVAAAVLIGLLGVGYWMYEKSNSIVVTADNNKHQTQNGKQNQSAQTSQTKQNTVAVKPVDSNLNVAQHQHQTQNNAQEKNEVAKNKIEPATSIIKKKKNIEGKKNEIVVAEKSSLNNKEKTNLNLPYNKQANSINENNIAQQPKEIANNNEVADRNNKNQLPVTTTTTSSSNNKEKNDAALPQVAKNNEVNNSTYKLYNVAYKEINPNNDDNSIHVGALDLNKTKVKGLLKKAGRLFGNKANKNANEDGKLQVANFEIQTNNL